LEFFLNDAIRMLRYNTDDILNTMRELAAQEYELELLMNKSIIWKKLPLDYIENDWSEIKLQLLGCNHC